MATVGTVVVVTHDKATPSAESVAEPVQNAQAELLLEMMLRSEGVWADGQLARFGLASADGGLQRNELDKVSVSTTGTGMDGSGSGSGGIKKHVPALDPAEAVVYEDMKDSFAGVVSGSEAATTQTFDFHVRIEPIAMDEAGYDLSGLRVGYIGDACFTEDGVIADCVATGEKKTHQATSLQYQYFFNDDAERETDMLAELGVQFMNQLQFKPAAAVDGLDPGLDDILDLLDDEDAESAYNESWQEVEGIEIATGDVYADYKDYLRDHFRPRIDLYDVIILGSGVDLGTLDNVRGNLHNWVKEGGQLIVLGTGLEEDDPLRPIVWQTVVEQEGTPQAAEPEHGLLTFPFRLRWQEYPDPGLAFELDENDAQGFAYVLDHDADVVVLATSVADAYDQGGVLLSMHRPGAVHREVGSMEGERFLTNLLVNAKIEPMVVDYGPEVPDDRPVGQALRVSFFDDPHFGQIPVRVTLHFWYT